MSEAQENHLPEEPSPEEQSSAQAEQEAPLPSSSSENATETNPESEASSPTKLSSKTLALMGILGTSTLLLGAYLSLGNPFHLQDANAEQDHHISQTVEMSANHLQVELAETSVEGQALDLKLKLHNLKPDTELKDARVTIQYSDTDYSGNPYQFERTWSLGRQAQSHQLLFQSPGPKTVQFKNAKGALLQEKTIEISPFQASIFPKDWEENKTLEQKPEAFHIWANLYYDAKEAPDQRQYLQITYQNQLVDRFLISSGAAGHATPQGEFKLGFKEYYPRSRRYGNTPMPFWSAINMNGKEGEYGFHSLEGGAYLYLLGKPASHGCIRLSRKPSVETHPETGKKFWGDRGGARWIFDRVPKETPVTIFSHKLPAFTFQDYHAYLLAEAKRYAEQNQDNTAG